MNHLAALAYGSVVLAIVATIVLKAVMVRTMALSRSGLPLDRALLRNQAWLLAREALLLSLLTLPWLYDDGSPWWLLLAWVAVSWGVVVSDVRALRALRAERAKR